MRRVFVIRDTRFPRGDAISNYLQYLMRALQLAGYEAYLLTNLNREFIRETAPLIKWNGISVCPISPSSNAFVRRVQYKLGLLFERMSVLKRFDIGASDVVIILGEGKPFLLRLLDMRKKRGFKVIGAPVELFEEKDFPKKRRKWQYWQYQDVMEHVYPRFDALMPISTYIEAHYKEKGVKTFCVPIMADCEEYALPEKNMDKIRFIIPANGKMKDDLCGMVRCFLHLSQEERKNIELHLCGVSQETLRGILSGREYECLQPMLTVHSWMVYDELIDLYKQMHFLLLSRGVSQMTLANFPSKVPEVMNMGIVPIVSDVGDYTKYYLEDGKNSIFIFGSGEQACYEAVQKALKLFPKQFKELSKNARRCVEERFDYHVWAPVIREMIEDVSGNEHVV